MVTENNKKCIEPTVRKAEVCISGAHGFYKPQISFNVHQMDECGETRDIHHPPPPVKKNSPLLRHVKSDPTTPN